MSDQTLGKKAASSDLSTITGETLGVVGQLEGKQIPQCKIPTELIKLEAHIALPRSDTPKTFAGLSNLPGQLFLSFMKQCSYRSIRETMANSRLRLVGKFLDRFWSSHTSPFLLGLRCRRRDSIRWALVPVLTQSCRWLGLS